MKLRILHVSIGTVFGFLGLVSAHATTFNIGASDVPALISAITTSNGNNQDDTIILTNSTYTLATRNNSLNGLPQIAPDSGHSLTIQGNGATIARSSAGGTLTFRFFYIQSGASVSLNNFTLTNGNTGSSHGGAIYEDGETGNVSLTLNSVFITGCSSDYGGAIFNDGYQDPSVPAHTATLNIVNCTISSNTASQYGGGVWNESGGIVFNATGSNFFSNTSTHSAGALQLDGSNGTATGTVSNCLFSGNHATNFGGAINVDGISGSATLVVTRCLFDQNSAGSGGALASDGSSGNAVLTVAGCTFSQNSANSFSGTGGAIDLEGAGGNTVVKVDSCTFSANASNGPGDGIYFSQTAGGVTNLQIGNSLCSVDVPGGRENFASNGTATVTSLGFNLSNDDANGGAGTGPGGFLNHAGDIRNTDPLLDPAGLKDNGGSHFTIALQASSPAIDKGKRNTIFALGNDDRGEPRPFDEPFIANAAGSDATDIGSYEADVRTVNESIGVNGTLFIAFTTILGHTYEVQSRTSLNPPAPWNTVNTSSPPPPISGTGGVVTVSVPNAIGGPGSGFYRIHQLP